MQATAILIVEDELVLRNSVMQALRAVGWNVFDAGSGEAAIALLHASLKPISALFTAIQLTGVLTRLGRRRRGPRKVPCRAYCLRGGP